MFQRITVKSKPKVVEHIHRGISEYKRCARARVFAYVLLTLSFTAFFFKFFLFVWFLAFAKNEAPKLLTFRATNACAVDRRWAGCFALASRHLW